MEPKAIVYTSNTGHTQKYAFMLGEKTELPVYSLDEAITKLPGGSGVIYLGWIFANHVKGFSRASKHFSVCAICGVGLSDTGTMISQVREATPIPEKIPLFTLQGGFDRNKLRGINKFMISMLTKGIASQKQRTEQNDRMLQLLSQNKSYVSQENLKDILDWYRINK